MTIEKPNYKFDMHCHTIRSDGRDTPKELIDRAVKIGMKGIAITDHDITPPETVTVNGKELDIETYAKNKGLKLIKGYEFSTDTMVEDVHILGYNLNWKSTDIKKEVKMARKSKTKAYQLLCKRLTKKGMLIDFKKDILEYKDKNQKKMVRKKDEVEKKFIFERLAEKGFVSDWKKAKIMIKNDPYLNIKRKKIHPGNAIKLIHDNGGIAVLAHPYLINKVVASEEFGELNRGNYIERLIKYGIDGIEARYTYNKTSYKGSKSVKEIEKEIIKLYGNRLLISGGSDYHGGQKVGIKNYRYIGEAGIVLEQFEKFLNNK